MEVIVTLVRLVYHDAGKVWWRYPGMKLNDWRHIIEDYTPMVRETLSRKAKEVVLQLKKAAEERNDD